MAGSVDPPIWFTTFHGPMVGDRWRCIEGGWGVVEVIEVSQRWDSTEPRTIDGVPYPGRGNVLVCDDKGMMGRWGSAPFMRSFTREL